MLEVLVKIFCALLMVINIDYIIKKITNQKNKLKWYQSIILIAILTTVLVVTYQIEYKGLNSLLFFLLGVIIIKYIYKFTLEESIISFSIVMVMVAFSDIVTSLIFMAKFPVTEIRTNESVFFFSNITVNIISFLFINIKYINNALNKFYNSILPKKSISNLLFFILLIIGFSYLIYNIGFSQFFNKEYIVNFLIFIIFTIITCIFIENQNKYKKLEEEYDVLFNYIQTFEDWIEKGQLNRHEYKNQLAVIRCLTKEKKIKDKIDEILEDNINIKDQAVTNLKNLPKGGIKGLMYYKAAIAQKQKIHLTTDVSINENGILSKLSEKNIRVLCKLIGIYFDNAIEAAAESRKKNLTIEVYELKDKVNFVFSNTFKNHKNMKDRNKKGVSSKGEGRGNGLYFASKLIKENKWITSKQEIIEKYYIQEISINKKNI